jgi:hypothetical protein
MSRSTLVHAATMAASLVAAPLAQAQQPATMPEHWGFIGMMAGFGILFLLGIFVIGSFTESRRQRQKLALIERLLTSGQPVPRELMLSGPQHLPLPEERRRDIRRGITLLCWAIAVSAIPIIGSGGEWRYGIWGLLFLLPSLGSFLKAYLTAREIARGAPDGSPQH